MAERLEREFSGFKKHFRDFRLHVDVGLRLYKAKRKEIDQKFYAVYEELTILIDPVEQHQITLSEGK